MALAAKLGLIAGAGGTAASTVDPNKLNHIFGKAQHNLSGFLNSFAGNQTNAYNAFYRAAQEFVTRNNISGVINAANEITIRFAGFDITFRGNVVDGILKLGTFFIK